MKHLLSSPETRLIQSSRVNWRAVALVTTLSVVAGLVILPASHPSAAAQETDEPAFYDDLDAYEIYNLLIPHEESYGFGKGTIVIRQEAEPGPAEPAGCLSADSAAKFKDALDDFKRVNARRWLLQPLFRIERPYEIVSADQIEKGFQTAGVPGGWEDFNARYPDSGGFFVMSAVGFNDDKTLAVVYSGSTCGGLCGRWSFHLLQKVDGQWNDVPGVRCMAVS